MTTPQTIYIFLDEGGNFDFSSKGSKYFTLTCVTTIRPFLFTESMNQLKYDLIEFGLDHQYFHCVEDNSHVRRRVFEIISQYKANTRIDSIIVEKPKTGPALQEPKAFYSKMLGYLIKYVVNSYNPNTINDVIVITDLLPISQKRNAVEKAVKQTLASMLPSGTKYRIMHHCSRAHYGLQIADYCN